MIMRTEKDFLGTKKIEDQALYGIHALRARENFPGNSRFNKNWYKAMGIVKHSCYLTYEKYSQAINKKYGTYIIEYPKRNRTLIGTCQKGRG